MLATRRRSRVLSDLMAKKAGRRSIKSSQFNMRLPDVLKEQLEELARRNLSDMTAEILQAIVERLRTHKLWPPEGWEDES